MTRRVLGASAAVVLCAGLAGVRSECSGLAREMAGARTQGDVVLSADPSDEVANPAAILSGQLTSQDGCLALDGSATLWPLGSRWLEAERAVILADGSRLEVGDRVKVGGGSVSPSVASNYSATAQEQIDACMRSLGAEEKLAVGLVILLLASAWGETIRMREDLEGLV